MNKTIKSLTTICVTNQHRRCTLTSQQPHEGQGICNLKTEEDIHKYLKISTGRIAEAHVAKNPIKEFHYGKWRVEAYEATKFVFLDVDILKI
jgi:hypothetical protein